MLTDHQALQPLLKRNRAHKQYCAGLTRWLDRLSHFDMNVQYTAGKNIPLTNYLSRMPITHSDESEVDNKTDSQEETEAEQEFVTNQIYGLFDSNRTVGTITQFIERTTEPQRSQRGKHTREQYRTGHLFETSLSSINLINKQPPKASMDKVNGNEMECIFKKRGHFPETDRLRTERNRILRPDRLQIVGKMRDNEKLQEYRSLQKGRKQIEKLNIEIYNRFFILARRSVLPIFKSANKIITSLG